MKHYFDTDGHEFLTPPDPYKGRSPMHNPDGTYNDDAFREMGGRIEDDGEPTPKERVLAELNTALQELSKQVPGVTIAEFKHAAATLYSGGLIAWAKAKSIPDEIIDAARSRIVEILADALRIGMTWDELIDGIEA